MNAAWTWFGMMLLLVLWAVVQVLGNGGAW